MGSRVLAIDCDRCGGVVNWGFIGPDPDDGSIGTTCTCAELDNAAAAEADLALALQLLDRYLPATPCLPVTDDSPARRRILGNPEADQVLPLGSCLAHWQYDGEPCRIGQGQALLARHGLRGGQ